jgi:hypothetical protein
MEQEVRKLCAVFTDEKRSESDREVAIRMLLRIGPAARWAIPELIAFLDDPKTSARLRRASFAVLTDMGPWAAPAVPTLVRLLKRSAARWEQVRALPVYRAVGSSALWLDGYGWDRWAEEVERQRRSGFTPEKAFLLPFDRWLIGEVESDQATILRALRSVGPAAAQAVEPLKQYLEKVRGRKDLERQALDALVAIER